MSDEESVPVDNRLIRNLTARRGHLKRQLTQFNSFVDKADQNNITEIKIRLRKIEDIWQEFDRIQSEIEDVSPDDIIAQNTEERETFEQRYFSIVAKAQEIVDKSAIVNSKPINSIPQSPVNQSQIGQTNIFTPNHFSGLPSIKLPQFTGSYENWLPFFEIFKSLIHENPNLSNIQKMYYLQTCLQGSAALIIQSLEISEENYNTALNLLKERYENKRILIHSHVKAIFDMPNINRENHISMRKMIDNFQRNFRALKGLEQPVDTWDTLLIYIISTKLDFYTRREWEGTIKNELPLLDDLLSFLKNKSNLLETLDTRTVNKFSPKNNYERTENKQIVHVSTDGPRCTFCKQAGHFAYKCSKLLALSIRDRFVELKKLNICINCLRRGHKVENCISKSCYVCNRRHNSILHDYTIINNKSTAETSVQYGDMDTNENIPSTSTATTAGNSNIAAFSQIRDSNSSTGARVYNTSRHSTEDLSQNHKVTLTAQNTYGKQILLATAMVYILDKNQQLIEARALLDSASQSNMITRELYERLKLRKINADIPIYGINQTACNILYKTNAQIQAMDGSYKVKLQFLVIDNITSDLPQISFNATKLNIPENCLLADPGFSRSNKIDILLGSEIFYDLLNVNKLTLGSNMPILQSTKLGWVLAGPMQTSFYTKRHINSKCFLITNNELDNKLERFWTMENIEINHSKLSNEELECELHFRKNVMNEESGKYIVKLPLKNNYTKLGESFSIAKSRLLALEKRLSKNPELQKEYKEFLIEYEKLGHMSKVDLSCDNENICNYLPHHCVTKDSSSTTKTRVVFDASCKTTSGYSLNDVLKIGPKVQSDIFDIVIRMRKHEILIIADIEKMYRMIDIHKSQRSLQRIIWREDPSSEMVQYNLNTITYGTASASFLATRVLHEVGLRCKTKYPRASEAIINDFYMDDLITGTDSVEDAISLRNELENILSKSQFNLRKWKSNSVHVLGNDNSNKGLPMYQINSGPDIKTLGIIWEPEDDYFRYAIKLPDSMDIITKRIILSNVAQLFDPLGLINPCIVQAKIIMQNLWKAKVGWDSDIPEDIRLLWLQFTNNIHHLNDLKIPRMVLMRQYSNIEIHGFCDASEAAYGACIYLVSKINSGQKMSRLLCAKSRLAPLKSISLPRLELCGALLLSQLMHKIIQALRFNFDSVTNWTDSRIVLSWLASEPNRWKVFVANRVAEIHNLSSYENNTWRHIASGNNPADIISRGYHPQKLIDERLWWQGPYFLIEEKESWPQTTSIDIPEIPEARKENIILSFVTVNKNEFFERYSSFNLLVRIMAYILRFIENCKLKNGKNRSPSIFLNSKEIEYAKLRLVKIVQAESFSDEIYFLKNCRLIPKNSKLYALAPFLDSDGFIRVGGRLKNSELLFDHKYPIVLPPKHKFTRLIIKHFHLKYLHAGAQFILNQIRTQFWPINGRNEIRSVLRKCITCFKIKPVEINQMMGSLPKARVRPSRPFSHCGLDYAGPFLIKDGKTRNRILLKAYICIFICLSTKAVHVELVTDLTTESFLNAFKRFVSRRGLCSRIYSDNAKTFVGADNYLKQIHELLLSVPKDITCQSYLSENQVEWCFIPPRSPHFGGIWEAAIKSFKYHLKRTIGGSNLNFEQFYTVLTQIEAILNSRPIFPLSNDPNDLQALTPGHFLIGESLVAVQQEEVLTIPMNRLNHFKHLQYILQGFWRRWSTDYLHTLQQRSKWCQERNNIQTDTLALLKEDHLPPAQWRLGRVMQLHPGTDGKVRVVSVRTKNGLFKRSITKICPLPISDDF